MPITIEEVIKYLPVCLEKYPENFKEINSIEALIQQINNFKDADSEEFAEQLKTNWIENKEGYHDILDQIEALIPEIDRQLKNKTCDPLPRSEPDGGVTPRNEFNTTIKILRDKATQKLDK
jgi:hypothetical protein